MVTVYDVAVLLLLLLHQISPSSSCNCDVTDDVVDRCDVKYLGYDVSNMCDNTRLGWMNIASTCTRQTDIPPLKVHHHPPCCPGYTPQRGKCYKQACGLCGSGEREAPACRGRYTLTVNQQYYGPGPCRLHSDTACTKKYHRTLSTEREYFDCCQGNLIAEPREVNITEQPPLPDPQGWSYTTHPWCSTATVDRGCGRSKYPDAGGDPEGLHPHIVGGYNARHGEFPWQVALVRIGSTSVHCGATLLTARSVLTAAHCVDGHSAEDFQVVVGLHTLDEESSSGRSYTIQTITAHQAYIEVKQGDDIAILTLTDAVEFNVDVQPVCPPPTNSQLEGRSVTVTGWGRIYSGGPSAETLQYTNLEVKSLEECKQNYEEHNVEIKEGMLCAGTATTLDRDGCQGDSGGPLVVFEDNVFNQIGIVSFGFGCADGTPGVYTDIAFYMDWLKDKII